MDIQQILTSEYGLTVSELEKLPLGADTNASVYKAEGYFIKVKKGHDHDISLEVAELLQQARFAHVIAPIKTKKGQPSISVDGYTLIVYPFIKGQDAFQRKLTQEQWFLLGKALKAVHMIQVPEALKNRIRKETYSDKWRKRVREMFTQENVPTYMLKRKEILLHLVDRAEELASTVEPEPHVLCHSDIHGGNVLLDEHNHVYIVDWDEPIMAPKERDLMFIGGGVANVWNKPDEEEWFYKGYGFTEVNHHLIAYYRSERIIEDIAVYYQEYLQASDPQKEVIRKYVTDMFEPRGVVDIAIAAIIDEENGQ